MRVFTNGDLNRRYEKYLEDGKISMEHLIVQELDEDTFALDIFWGDGYIDCDSYLYPTNKEAVKDGMELHILSLRKEFERIFSERI